MSGGPRCAVDLRAGVFALLDACGDHERDAMHAALGEAGRLLLRDTVEMYGRFHKYTGRV